MACVEEVAYVETIPNYAILEVPGSSLFKKLLKITMAA